ncbi:hypothetical protein D9M68_722680 [compost metagenome]
MDISIAIAGILIVLIIPFVYFIIKRNRKDQRELEEELNKREMKPDKHDGDHI